MRRAGTAQRTSDLILKNEWTFDMVRRHFDEHETNQLKILYDMIITASDAMNFCISNMAYYEQTRGDEKMPRQDFNAIKIWLALSNHILKILRDFQIVRYTILTGALPAGMRGNGGIKPGAAGGGGGNGTSSAMSKLTQNAATRGATGFNNR
jgi:hypothetical protein